MDAAVKGQFYHEALQKVEGTEEYKKFKPKKAVAGEEAGKLPWEGKQDWEMTKSEIAEKYAFTGKVCYHEDAIKQAQKEGEEIPERVLAEYPDLKPEKEVAGEKVEKAEVPKIIKPKLEEKYGRFLEKVGKRLESEAIGQDILDTLEEKKMKPANVSKTFWEDTFFKLPSEAQNNITKYFELRILSS